MSKMFLLSTLITAALGAELRGGATCDSNGQSEASCLAATENGQNCAYCMSAAAGGNCFTESDAKTLPASVFECEYAASYKHLAVGVSATDCEAAKKEADCMGNSQACAWCSSGSQGAACYKEADAQGLPSSIFECEFQATYKNLGVTAGDCGSQKKEADCMSGDACAWCSSGSQGAACYDEADAKGLPSSIFECEFQSTYFTSLALTGSTCESASGSEATCLAQMEGNEQCVYCMSAAAGGNCFKESDAETLPTSVFECTYATTYRSYVNKLWASASQLYNSLRSSKKQ